MVARFFRSWRLAYTHPQQFADVLREAEGPYLGLFATLLRGAFDSILVYLPVHFLGRLPPTPSYLPFIPTERYYLALVGIGPLVFLAHWLFFNALAHVALRIARRPSNIDVLLNCSGMIGLAIGAVLVLYDWLFILGGWGNQWVLGGTHLLIDLWAIAISVIGLKRLLGTPVWLGVLINILAIVTWLPLAVMFMRSPV
jgi:hypothetical protein